MSLAPFAAPVRSGRSSCPRSHRDREIRRRLNHRDFVFLVNETHRNHPLTCRGEPTNRCGAAYSFAAAALVRSGTKTCLNRWLAGRACRCRNARPKREEPDGKGLLRRVLAPFARRGAEPLFEDPAEMGEVVKAPRECDVADMPGHVGGIRQVALASIQALHLDVAAERDLLGGHQVAGIARRDSHRRRCARQ